MTLSKHQDTDFMALVDEYRLNWKCSKTEAIHAVMKRHPAAHQAYLAAVQPPQSSMSQTASYVTSHGAQFVEDTGFMALVDDYRQQRQCTKTEAIQATMTSHPEVHQAYLTASQVQAADGGDSFDDVDKRFSVLVDHYQKENKCDRTVAVKAVMNIHPDLYESYIQSFQTH